MTPKRTHETSYHFDNTVNKENYIEIHAITLQTLREIPLKILKYRRVSTSKQEASGEGFKTQSDDMDKYIEENFPNAEIVGELSEQESGFKVPFYEREKGEMILEMSLNHYKKPHEVPSDELTFNCIMVYHSDRFSRQDENLTLKELEHNGIFVVSSSENRLLNYLDAQASMMNSLVQKMNEVETIKMQRRALSLHARKRRNGEISNGQLAYGFKWNKEEKRIEEVQEQVEVYKWIINAYMNEDKGSQIIAEELNASGYLFVDNHKNTTSHWTKDNVLGLIKNPIMTGHIKYKDYIELFNKKTGKKEKLKRDLFDMEYIKKRNDLKEHISFDLWIEMNLKRMERGNGQVSVKGDEHMLTGLLMCNECGKPMKCTNKGTKEKPNFKYYCKSPKSVCSKAMGGISKEDIHYDVTLKTIDYLSEMKLDKKEIQNIIEQHLTSHQNKKSDAIEKLEKEIIEKKKEINKVEDTFTELFKDNSNDAKFLANATKYHIQQKERLDKELLDLEQKYANINHEQSQQEKEKKRVIDANFLVDNLFTYLNENTNTENKFKRLIMQTLIKQVVNDYGKIKITWLAETDEDLPKTIYKITKDEVKEELNEILTAMSEVSATIEGLGVRLPRELPNTPISLQLSNGLSILHKYKNN